MTRTTARTLTLTTLAALAAVLAGTPAAPPGLVGTAQAQQVKPEDLAAEWDKGWDRAASESAKAYESLYKWCLEKHLNFTAINVRRVVLWYDPHNEEVRKYVGYRKTPDGTWIRDEARRDAIREEADIEDPKAQKYNEKRATTDKKVIQLWKALATKAKKSGESDAANVASWNEKATKAWEKVLQADSSNEEAHKALNHPKFAGKYCRPEALPYLKVRDERKQGGLKRAQLPFKVQMIDMTGELPQAGLAGGGAKSDHFVANSVHGKDVAARHTQWAERTVLDFCEIYGVPADIMDRLPWHKYETVKDQDELKKVLRAIGWKDPEIERFTKFFGGRPGIVPDVSLMTASAGVDSDDWVIHTTGHGLGLAARNMAVQDVGSPNEGIEDWLQESIAYDITRRMTGTTITTCGAFGKYGTDIDPNPAKDIWIELARRLVEYDDDVPLSRLYKCKHEEQNLRGPETVKGYAFIQYLFESDTEKARKFVWTALAQGTPSAVAAVYGSSGDAGGAAPDANTAMDELDAKYREWIIKSW